MTVHHKPAPARAIEHAKSKDSVAHRLISPGAPEGGHRTTRGFAAGNVVNGKTVHAQPALDVQPRHGGKAKGGVVAHSWGNTEQQIAQADKRHLIDGAASFGIAGNPDASSANPLDLMNSSQTGKHQPPCMVHPGMTRQQIGDAHFNGEDILKEAAGLPKTVTED